MAEKIFTPSELYEAWPVLSAPEDLDQEALSKLFMRHHLLMIPIVDAEGRIKGVVNVNDIVDVLQEEATEDIQKIGGVASLEGPYLQVPLRVGWSSILALPPSSCAARCCNVSKV